MKLNLGCGGVLISDYINIDLDSLDDIKKRYPNHVIEDNVEFLQSDALSLPFEDSSIDEIKAEAFLEHLSFIEEPLFFKEMKRVLRKGGVLNFSVNNFEVLIEQWLSSRDEWKDFFRNDNEAIEQEHWFGTYSYHSDNRWGYLMASIFGTQNGQGQFHKNAYSKLKILNIFKKINFEVIEISDFRWKGNRDKMIRAIGRKK